MHTNEVKKEAPKDWHKAYISAALKEKGTNLSALAEANNYSRNGLRNALYRPYPKAEKIIAKAIGVTPKDIWPSRYAK